jgi:hypothetical protein
MKKILLVGSGELGRASDLKSELLHFSHELLVGTTHFFHVDQPVFVGFAVAQRQ